MVVGPTIRKGYVIAWVLLIVAVALPTAIRLAMREPDSPAVVVAGLNTEHWVTLDDLKEMASLSRAGDAQNQFGNWREAGTYTGVLLTALFETLGETVRDVEVVATDGYRVVLEEWRILDSEYPVVLAYAMDGVEIPDWEDGPRIVVLPEDGSVSNEEYAAESAGSYWVKNVERIVLVE